MKSILSLLFACAFAASTASAAIVLYVSPSNTLPDAYWPDLPGAKNIGNGYQFGFPDNKNQLSITSELDGKNAKVGIVNGTSPSEFASQWRLDLAINSSGQVDRLTYGSLIGANSNWISKTSGSELLTPFETNLSVTVAETMFVGYRQVNTVTGDIYYGWAELKTVPLRTDGFEESWAVFGWSSAGVKFTSNGYDNTGLPVFAGQTVAIPEPSASLLGAGSIAITAFRCRRL